MPGAKQTVAQTIAALPSPEDRAVAQALVDAVAVIDAAQLEAALRPIAYGQVIADLIPRRLLRDALP